jgi:nitrous-oxide reductase
MRSWMCYLIAGVALLVVAAFVFIMRNAFEPEHIKVKKDQRVVWHLTNLERTRDATHGFTLPGYGIGASLEPGETVTGDFVADREGVYSLYCSEFSSALHLEMMGYPLVKP